MQTKPASRHWRRLILMLLGTIAGVCAAELALFAGGISYPRTSQRDDDRGYARRPGIEWHQREEGEAQIRINSAGFRDREWQIEKPANTVRIAMLGDSYTEALQVARKDRVTEVLESILKQSPEFAGKNVEVLNFGVSGYGTAQEFLTLKHRVFQYSPDIVVVGFLTGNDIRNNSRVLESDSGRPYFVLRNGKLTLDPSFLDAPEHIQTWWKKLGYFAIDYSRLLQLAYRARRKLVKRRLVTERTQQATNKSKLDLNELGLDVAIYSEPDNDDWKDAWQVTEGILQLMQEEVRAHDAELLVVTLSSAAQVHPSSSTRKAFCEKLGVDSPFYPDNRVKQFGIAHGIHVLNLAQPLQEYAEQNQVFLHGFANTTLGKGHWNEEGHKLAADLIAKRIRKMIGSGEDQAAE